MENAVVKYDAGQSLALQQVGEGLFKSGLFPNAKNGAGAFAIVQYGAELGIGPMMALKNINIISGQLACNAQLMLHLAMQKGVIYDVEREDDRGAIILFHRKGYSDYRAEFLEKDAQAANLLGKDNWKKYPKDMYFWRAVAKGIRRIAPDAVMGLYTADEITEGKVIDVEIKEDKPRPKEVLPQEENPRETRVYEMHPHEAKDVPGSFGDEAPDEKEIIKDLKKALNDAMPTVGFKTKDSKKEFYDWVVKGRETVDVLQNFKDNIVDYKNQFMKSKEA